MNYENLKEFNFKNVFMTPVNSKRLSLSVRGNYEKSHKCALWCVSQTAQSESL